MAPGVTLPPHGSVSGGVSVEVQEVLAQFLGGDRLRGFAEVFSELAHTGQIRLLRAGEQGQEAEVFEEAV